MCLSGNRNHGGTISRPTIRECKLQINHTSIRMEITPPLTNKTIGCCEPVSHIRVQKSRTVCRQEGKQESEEWNEIKIRNTLKMGGNQTYKKYRRKHKKISTFFLVPWRFSDSLIIVGGSLSFFKKKKSNLFRYSEMKGETFFSFFLGKQKNIFSGNLFLFPRDLSHFFIFFGLRFTLEPVALLCN